MYNKLNNPVISAVIVFQFTELGESTSLWKLSLHGQVFKGSDHKSPTRTANNFMLLVTPLRRTRQNHGASWLNDPSRSPLWGRQSSGDDRIMCGAEQPPVISHPNAELRARKLRK